MNNEDTDGNIDEYQDGFHAGWDACHARFTAILKRFPLQCAMISNRLPLHPSQPDKILEPDEFMTGNS